MADNIMYRTMLVHQQVDVHFTINHITFIRSDAAMDH